MLKNKIQESEFEDLIGLIMQSMNGGSIPPSNCMNALRVYTKWKVFLERRVGQESY